MADPKKWHVPKMTRLCVPSDGQNKSVDLDEKYALVVSWGTVSLRLTLSISCNWK